MATFLPTKITGILLLFLSVSTLSAKGTTEGKDDAGNVVSVTAAFQHQTIDQYINDAIEAKAFPGAQLIIGDSSGIVYAKNYGYLDYEHKDTVTDNNLYDLASCTKVMATTLAIMKLVGDQQIFLSDKLGDLVPRFRNTAVANLTLSQLLTHTSGMKAGISLSAELVEPANEGTLFSYRKDELHPYRVDSRLYINKDIKYNASFITTKREENTRPITDKLFIRTDFDPILDSMIIASYTPSRRGTYRYSDLNFYFIQQIIEERTGETLDNYVKKIYHALNLFDIGYNPLDWKPKEYIAPTECDYLMRRDTIRGYVHDELAAVLGGVSGNAGLFANAKSMAVICQMLLKKGEYKGCEIIKPEIVEKFTASQIPGGRIYRGLGFDKQNPASTPYSKESYGHSGFTGTYFWIDPANNMYVILLTNRVYPTRVNNLLNSDFRSKLWTQIKEELTSKTSADTN